MIQRILITLFIAALPLMVGAQGFDFIGRLPSNPNVSGVPCSDVVERYVCSKDTTVSSVAYNVLKDCQDNCKDDKGQPAACYAAYRGGTCTLDNLFGSLSLIVQWGTTVAGGIALLMFVIGGIYFLGSGGSQDRVKRGKDILVGTTIALFFILGSWLLINFVLQTFGVNNSKFQLTSECSGKSKGSACGPDRTGRCDTNGLCLSACDYQNVISPPEFAGKSWACQPIEVCNGGTTKTCAELGQFCIDNETTCPTNSFCCYNPN